MRGTLVGTAIPSIGCAQALAELVSVARSRVLLGEQERLSDAIWAVLQSQLQQWHRTHQSDAPNATLAKLVESCVVHRNTEIIDAVGVHSVELIDGNLAFQVCCEFGDTMFYRKLLQHSRTIHIDPASDGDLPLHIATMEHRVEIVRMLLRDHRVSPSCSVFTAARLADDRIIDAYLSSGRIDASMSNNALLMVASAYGNSSVVRRLMREPNVDPSIGPERYGSQGPLMMACMMGKVDVARMLLSDARVHPTHDIRLFVKRHPEPLCREFDKAFKSKRTFRPTN